MNLHFKTISDIILFPFKSSIKYIKLHYFLLIFLFLLTIVRLSLVKSGHLYWIDELRYVNALCVLEHLSENQVVRAISRLFEAHGRPGYVLLSIIPATIQMWLVKMGFISSGVTDFIKNVCWLGMVSTRVHPDFFNVVSVFNVIITVLISFMFYHILLVLLNDKKLALFGTFIYSLLCNSNLYIRHFIPYDLSLLFFLLAVFIVLKANLNNKLRFRTAFLSGLISAFAFTICPSYYMFVPMIAVLIFSLSKNKFRMLFCYFLISFLFILFVEGVAYWCKVSFIKNILQLSGSVIQGSFEEGYIFIFRYLTKVEGPIGYVLIAMFFIYVFLSFYKSSTDIKSICLASILGYLCHATMSVVFKKMVFYGRIMHMYIPVMVLGTVVVVSFIRNKKLQNMLILFISLVSTVSFLRYISQYINLSYPLDFRIKYSSNMPKGSVIHILDDHKPNEKRLSLFLGIFINDENFYPVPDGFFYVKPPANFELIDLALHPLNFPAYQYEGHSIEGRKKIAERNYHMRFYAQKFLQYQKE